MKLETLIRYCLSYLEQDGENDVMNDDYNSIVNNESFKEYVVNMQHSLYQGMCRYASANVLPIKDEIISEWSSDLKTEKGNTKFTKIFDVYAIDNANQKLVHNIQYSIIGSKIFIKKFNKALEYHVLYHPRIMDLREYNENVTEIELNELGITDDMAINLKYMVYSELKIEDNPSVANINKNYFETYLEDLKKEQIIINQVNLIEDNEEDEEENNGYTRPTYDHLLDF